MFVRVASWIDFYGKPLSNKDSTQSSLMTFNLSDWLILIIYLLLTMSVGFMPNTAAEPRRVAPSGPALTYTVTLPTNREPVIYDASGWPISQ